MSKTFKEPIREAEAGLSKASPSEAHAAHQGGDVLLDVREPGGLDKQGRIRTAMHIPRGILESRACGEAETKDSALCDARGKRVFVMCASGARATLAADTLKKMGYNAVVVEGGFKAWKDAGLALA